jgi:hypothetical protein
VWRDRTFVILPAPRTPTPLAKKANRRGQRGAGRAILPASGGVGPGRGRTPGFSLFESKPK